MIIIGIDPGLATTGFAILNKDNDCYSILDSGIIETPKGLDLATRLNMIKIDLEELIKKYKPEILGVEEIFFCNNTKTAINVAHSRGVILETFFTKGIEIKEFTPLEVKQIVTGYGKADKKQIYDMLCLCFPDTEIPKQDDAADAIAIAYAAGEQR